MSDLLSSLTLFTDMQDICLDNALYFIAVVTQSIVDAMVSLYLHTLGDESMRSCLLKVSVHVSYSHCTPFCAE